MTSGDVTTQGTGASPGGQAQQWSPARNPTRRPMLRTALTIGVAASVFLICLLILLGILDERLTTQTLITSALMAIIPLLIIVPTFLWLDRYEAEPVRYIVFAFLWGALVAVVGAFFLNTFGLKMLVEARWTDPLETGAVYLAPITEETLKGLGILLIYLLRRREFDGIIDGIVYGGLIGAGFAFSENILYLGQAYNEYGGEGLTSTFLVRGLMGPFGHPLFTSLTGIGIGIAVTARRPAVRVVAILTGWFCAMLLHGLWNLTALAGMDGFFAAYVTYQVPLFLAFVGFLFWLRRREGRLMGRYLSPYADAGWLSLAEVRMLSTMAGRRAARVWARSSGGRAALAAMRTFQDAASELALLRVRMQHSAADAGAVETERELLDTLGRSRSGFLGGH